MGSVPYRVRTVACAIGALLPAALPAQTIVSGFVKDSLTGKALAGAVVQLIPAATPWLAGRMTKSDSLGRFRVDSVAPGQYLFGFQHPRLDSLGVDGVTRTIDIDKAVRVLRADLAVPSGRTFVSSLCGPNSDSTGAVMGRVFNAEDGEPIAGGTVAVRYAEMRLDGGGVRRVPVQLTAKFGTDGKYVVCGLPVDAPVVAQARAGAGTAATSLGTSGEVELTFAPKVPLVHRDLFVSLRPPVAAGAAPGAAPVRASAALPRTGTARLIGRVIAGDGTPVAGARVTVLDTDVSAVADSAGTFRLSGLPAGTRSVEVVAIGYSPARAPADLRPNRDATVSVNVGARMATLSAVKVTGAPVDRSGFLARRTQGIGFFLDAAAIEARGLQSVASTLTTVPGLRGNGYSRQDPTRPNVSGRGNCVPSVYLDGMQMRDGTGGLDDVVSVRRLGAIEVYASAMEAPPQFSGNANCAVILVWSKAYVP